MSKVFSCVENEIVVCRRNPEEKLINTCVIWPPYIRVEWAQFIFFYPLKFLKIGKENATYVSIGDLSKQSVEETICILQSTN